MLSSIFKIIRYVPLHLKNVNKTDYQEPRNLVVSNTKYFLLGVGTPECREPSKPSADVPWETQIWNWLCLPSGRPPNTST